MVRRMYVKAKKDFLMYYVSEGFAIVDFVKKTGVSRPTVYVILKQKRVKPSTAKAICDALGLKMMDYFDLDME